MFGSGPHGMHGWTKKWALAKGFSHRGCTVTALPSMHDKFATIMCIAARKKKNQQNKKKNIQVICYSAALRYISGNTCCACGSSIDACAQYLCVPHNRQIGCRLAAHHEATRINNTLAATGVAYRYDMRCCYRCNGTIVLVLLFFFFFMFWVGRGTGEGRSCNIVTVE